MSDFFGKIETVRARKSHQCFTCFRTIDAGEHYSAQFVVYYDIAQRLKQCTHCIAVWDIWRPEDMDGLISEGGYDDWLWGDTADLPELRAKVQYRMKWRRKDGTLHPIPA